MCKSSPSNRQQKTRKKVDFKEKNPFASISGRSLAVRHGRQVYGRRDVLRGWQAELPTFRSLTNLSLFLEDFHVDFRSYIKGTDLIGSVLASPDIAFATGKVL